MQQALKRKKNEMKSEIGYIRKEIAEFDVPAYEGERYEDLVPDALLTA